MIYPEPKTLTLMLPDWDPFLAELGVPLPWALIPIADQPLLAHWLDCALDIGYERVRIIGRDPTRSVEKFLAEATLWPLELVFLREVEVSAKSTDYRKLTTLPRASTVTPSVDSAWDLICLRQSLEQERLEALSPEDCIGAHGTIDPSATLSGPYWIGPDVTIEAGVQILPYTVIAAGCVVSSQATLADCRLEANMRVGPFTHLDGHWAGAGFLLNQVKQIRHQDPDPEIVGSLS